MEPLTISLLKTEAGKFAEILSSKPIPDLHGITDGKAIGTYIEQAFNQYLQAKYLYTAGNAASGIDFPEQQVDLKVTSISQPQSSCPFRDASQKIYGLGYHLLVLVYKKIDQIDQHNLKTSLLVFQHAVFVHKDQTGDFQTTNGLQEILRRQGNLDDVIAFLEDRNLPVDEIGRKQLAEQIINHPPELGYLTISNALQWRLQYRRIIEQATLGTEGVENLMG